MPPVSMQPRLLYTGWERQLEEMMEIVRPHLGKAIRGVFLGAQDSMARVLEDAA
jgi:hypothetical protein